MRLSYASSARRARQPWLVFWCLLLLQGCSGAPTEQKLRETIEEMQTAVVERRPSDFMQNVTDDFVGNDGIDRAALHNLLRAQILRNASLGATLGPLEVQLQGERAQVRFSAVLTGGAGGLLPERAQAYAITTGWRLVDEDWKLFLAEWEPQL